MEYILEAKNVSKSFGSHLALNQVSLEIPKNCIYGLLGPNGAGKTTLLRIVNQIIHADSGEVYLDGKPLAPHHIAQIGYLPEERGLYKSMKVGEQAMYLAQLKGLSKQEAQKRLKFWFDRFDISDWWNKKVQELSKGMAQKIQFVVTVLHEPKLLIFDEPFSGFDPINANIIKDEILRLKDEGASIIFSTHRMESVEELCDHIALIHKSNLILEGKLSEVKNAYKNNIFSVGITPGQNWKDFVDTINPNYQLLDYDYFENENQLSLKLQLPSEDTGGILGQLASLGNVNRFKEIIPSANDIFIKTVEEEETNE